MDAPIAGSCGAFGISHLVYDLHRNLTLLVVESRWIVHVLVVYQVFLLVKGINRYRIAYNGGAFFLESRRRDAACPGWAGCRRWRGYCGYAHRYGSRWWRCGWGRRRWPYGYRRWRRLRLCRSW